MIIFNRINTPVLAEFFWLSSGAASWHMHLCGEHRQSHLLQKYINLDIVNVVDPVALSIFNTVIWVLLTDYDIFNHTH